MTNKRTHETIERCLEMTMAARDQALDGLLVATERDLRQAQIEMIIFGMAGDMEVFRVIEDLSTEAMQELLTPMVAAGEKKLEEIQAGPIAGLCRSVREIQRDVILAALAEWDRRREAAAEALQLCVECKRMPNDCDCGRFEREG